MNAAALDTIVKVTSATADAPAKLNLTLDILGRRDDGFHELRSLAVGVDLCDRITCSVRSQSGITLNCTDPELGGDDNLAYRAAAQLAKRCGKEPALNIELRKAIPVAAGLGGGSSDAATTLRLCNRLWGAGLDRTELATIGAELGSDVPLFFFLPAALLTGRGDRVEPVRLRWSGWVLLVFVDVVVSTAEVYRAWRASDAAGLPSGMDRAILEVSSADELTPMLSNHLEPAVFRVSPTVARACEELDRLGIGPMRVSGAGSVLFRLFDNPEAARNAASRIENHGTGLRTLVVATPAGNGQDPIISKEC
jgi:4-diphosphocytidyl-2-C-methyl-D-erythritol kinase